MSVLLSIEANNCSPPEVVDAECGNENVGIVGLVVVADPGSDESPHSLPGWISTQS